MALALLLIAAGRLVAPPGSAALLRHAYLLPVVGAGLRLGLLGGALTGAAAVVLDAPLVLPGVERAGLTVARSESLVTFVLVLAAGVLAGALADVARARRARYELLLAAQEALAGEVTVDEAVERLRACLAARISATGLALAVRDGGRVVVAGAAGLGPESWAAGVLAQGRPIFVPDLRAGARPRRAMVVPLPAGEGCGGVLAVEREGEVGRAERQALVTLGVQLGLGLQNARLASRQRRFADELATRVAEATERLAQMDRAKSMFVAVASHELRTPLTALLGFGELLASRSFPAGETRRLANIVRRETERLVRIVDDFLDLSRLERGLPPAITPEAVPVAPAVAAVADLFRGAGTHRIVVDAAPDLPAVHADGAALDRVLKNLVGNALKYSPPGSHVRLTVRATPGGVEFAVADPGQGIPAEALPRIFEPYYRAPGAAGTARGAGLGLAVVKALIDAHGGEIGVTSEPGRGTRIAFRLPVAS